MDLVFFDDAKAIEKYAKKLDLHTVVIAKNFKSLDELSQLRKKLQHSKLESKTCKLIETNNPKEINRFYKRADMLAAVGGTPTTNKFAASNRRIDLLLQPCGSEKLTFDTGIANLLKQNRIPVGILFSKFLAAKGFNRASLFKNYFFTAKICKKFGIELNIFSGAHNEYELRSPEDLLALKNLLEVRE